MINRCYYTLRARKDDKEYVLVGAYGDKANGGYLLDFEERKNIRAIFGGVDFSSEKQAWFYWYNKKFPERFEGWTPFVTMFEV